MFDNEMMGQIAYAGFMIGEVTCPTKYFDEVISINFKRSLKIWNGSTSRFTHLSLATLGFGQIQYLQRH